MDFYHNWLYEYILNTNWFIWIIIILVMGGNIVSPILLWFLMSGKKIPFFNKNKQQDTAGVKQE
ncbi:hypothetical protein RCG17_02650 [Neobacillus sp. PS3-12]|uniref:hypothetical protein n=1 Tax=Neobacillus sp. PS3-12 TaxID=3070677 RepID=UPI0027DF465D|nr:hypothetical protein [Neobacillus sp. PS3-12]WML53598.1 hypothetical protein RCG17_02650 [Neobacillus sp. PS3-12]